MQEVCQFLKDAGFYYIATDDNGQPRVRPFGTAHIFEDKLYIQTGRKKDFYRQISEHPQAEICAFHKGVTLRIAATFVTDDRIEAEQSLLEAYPGLQKQYQPGDGNNVVLYMKDATATFGSMHGEGRVVKF